MLSLSIRKLCTHSQLWGLHSPSTCLVQNFQIFTGDNFFHTYTLHTCFRVHSPYSYLVYTLQAHVRFKIFKFSRELFFFHTYTLHTCFRIHSPYSYLVYTLQAHIIRFKIYKFSREFIFFILTLSTHVSRFTLHTVIWFTLSKHMLGSKFSRDHFFMLTLSTHVSGFTLHTVIWFTLSKHMLGSTFLDFHRISFCSYLHSPLMFQSSLYMQLFLHSPSRCYISKFYIVIIISSCA